MGHEAALCKRPMRRGTRSEMHAVRLPVGRLLTEGYE
jgi:hypothetical protein